MASPRKYPVFGNDFYRRISLSYPILANLTFASLVQRYCLFANVPIAPRLAIPP